MFRGTARAKEGPAMSLIRNGDEFCAPSLPVLRRTRGGLTDTDRRGSPLMHVEDRDSMERLQGLAERDRGTRTRARLRAVIPAKEGATAPEIARALGFRRRAVRAWVAAYNRGGPEASPDRP